MEFFTNFYVYGVNDDNTITFYVYNQSGGKDYYRSRAHYSALSELGKLIDTQDFSCPMISGVFKISFVRGVGLVLTLVSYKIIEDDLSDLPFN